MALEIPERDWFKGKKVFYTQLRKEKGKLRDGIWRENLQCKPPDIVANVSKLRSLPLSLADTRVKLSTN